MKEKLKEINEVPFNIVEIKTIVKNLPSRVFRYSDQLISFSGMGNTENLYNLL